MERHICNLVDEMIHSLGHDSSWLSFSPGGLPSNWRAFPISRQPWGRWLVRSWVMLRDALIYYYSFLTSMTVLFKPERAILDNVVKTNVLTLHSRYSWKPCWEWEFKTLQLLFVLTFLIIQKVMTKCQSVHIAIQVHLLFSAQVMSVLYCFFVLVSNLRLRVSMKLSSITGFHYFLLSASSTCLYNSMFFTLNRSTSITILRGTFFLHWVTHPFLFTRQYIFIWDPQTPWYDVHNVHQW